MSIFPLNLRRMIELWILFFLIVFAAASYSSGYSLEWIFMAGWWFFLILIDFMFFDEKYFVFDPLYASWVSKITPSAYD